MHNKEQWLDECSIAKVIDVTIRTVDPIIAYSTL
jgi:hypothetical protein